MMEVIQQSACCERHEKQKSRGSRIVMGKLVRSPSRLKELKLPVGQTRNQVLMSVQYLSTPLNTSLHTFLSAIFLEWDWQEREYVFKQRFANWLYSTSFSTSATPPVIIRALSGHSFASLMAGGQLWYILVNGQSLFAFTHAADGPVPIGPLTK